MKKSLISSHFAHHRPRDKLVTYYLNAYIKENDNQKYFDYLERLRQSGETNMYGAAPYLQSEFPELRYDRNRAGDILLAWIRTFNGKEDDTPC